MTASAADITAELGDWQANLRKQFPIVTDNPELCYLDSAATAQKPNAVLEATTNYLTRSNANAGRGSYPWANETTARVERVRGRVKEFLGDPDPDATVVQFVSGTSDGLRRVALDWLAPWLRDGDEIIVPFGDHSANLLPWTEARDVLSRQGKDIVVHALPVDSASGDYDHRALPELVNERTRFVAVTHVHHVFGGDMNVHRIREVVGPDVPICLDAAQSVGHRPVSVAELDVDFVVFSGHKMMALPGIGAVWARNRRGPEFTPGGWSGTPNTSGIVSLEAAMDWLDAAGLAKIGQWTSELCIRLTDGLSRLPKYRVQGCQQSLTRDSTVQRREGIVTFTHDDIESADLGFILSSKGFMVRVDSHCQAGKSAKDGSVRVSVHVYNTVEEIDGLLEVLAELR